MSTKPKAAKTAATKGGPGGPAAPSGAASLPAPASVENKQPTNRWGAPIGDGLINLHDHDFDYEGFFERFKAGSLEPGEEEEFSARIYGMFCRDVFKSGGDMSKVSFWAANYIAEKLHQVLGGVPWHDIMSLPWDEPTPLLTARGRRAFDIYAHVKNTLRDKPDANITDLINDAAKMQCVSYETARADYYAMKNDIESNSGIRRKFLNRQDDIQKD